MIFRTSEIWDKEIRYDNDCLEIGQNCIISIEIPKDVEGPIFFYYGLDNFHQNHRRYLNSRDVDQLQGEIKEADDLESTCEFSIYMKDTGRTQSWGGNELDPETVANPCGLVARSVFNGMRFIKFAS